MNVYLGYRRRVSGANWGVSEHQRETGMSKPQKDQESWAALVTPEAGGRGGVLAEQGQGLGILT